MMRGVRREKARDSGPETQGFKTLTSMAGVGVEVSHHFGEIPEAERGPVALAAWVEPWPQEDQFRPNLVVEVEQLTPATATIQQLNARTIAAQIALGRHLVGCEFVPAEDSPGDGPARCLVAIYPALDTTVVQWQHVAILGNRAVIVTMQAGAANYAAGTRAFAHAVRTLSASFADPPVQPDPGLMPTLDPLGLARGEQLEDLTGISAAQAPAADGELEAFDEHDGGGARRRLLIELTEQGSEPVSVVVPQRADAIPVALARLLRVAPAWIWGLSEAERSVAVDRAAFEARLRDPSTPPPAGASPGLVRVWEDRWRQVTIDGRPGNGILVAETAGAHGFKPAGGGVRLTPMGSFEILRPLLQLGGFELDG